MSNEGTESPKFQNRIFGQRSSSLDESSPISESLNLKADTSSLFSRITRTFEDKINEIRSEKSKDKDLKILSSNTEGNISTEERLLSTEIESESPNNSKFLVNALENKENCEVSLTPSVRPKTSLVQDITEQTNKLKSDFSKNIRPKLSELRNRKSSKDNVSTVKPKTSIFHSILSREDNIVPTEALLSECHAVENAVEAHENGLTEQCEIKDESPLISKPSSLPLNTTENNRLPSDTTKQLNVPDNTNVFIKENLFQFLHDVLIKHKVLTTKLVLIFFIICFILPLPRFFAGVIFGIGIASTAFIFIAQLIMPNNEAAVSYAFPSMPNEVKKDTHLLYEVIYYHHFPLSS